MKKNIASILNAVCAIGVALMLTSCINYSDVKGAMQHQSYDNSVKLKPLRTGIACTTNALFLFTFGDSSIETAMRNGDITKVAFVDTSYTDFYFYYPFYQKGCTIVKGE